MKLLILKAGFGEGCDYTIGCNQTWKVEDFEGTIKEAEDHYTKLGIYSGDIEGTPEGYARIDTTAGQLEKLIILPYIDAVNVDMDKARQIHNSYWDKKLIEETENKEKAEYIRLKKKFEN